MVIQRCRVLLPVLLATLIVACVTTPETGRHAFLIVPEDTELGLGEQAFAEVKAKEKLSTDPAKNDIVLRVGQRIAGVTNRADWKWEFKVIESEQVNAFCLPGGKVAFYTGIFPLLENEAGLATVMGHEVAHATARHGGQRISQQLVIGAGLTAASLSLGNTAYHDPIMGLIGAGATVGVELPFSRSHEAEADEIGLIYMARAGYDPGEAPNLWRRFAAHGGKKPPEILSTHPSDESRINHLERLQPKAQFEYMKAKEKRGRGQKVPT